MSHTRPTSTSYSNFQLIFNNALKAYERRTKKDLLAHPLAAQLQPCDSPSSILIVLQQQVQELNQSQSSDERLTKWLDPTVNVLYTLSETLGEGVSLVFSPAKAIFAGIGVILSTAKDVRAGQDALFEVFERIEAFFHRLEIYPKAAFNEEMVDIITNIMVEVLNVLGIATKEIRQGRMKKYLKKLIGRTDIEDALKRLDRLTQEEARMASAQLLKMTNAIDSEVREIADNVLVIDDRVAGVDDRVAGVDDRVADVDERVAGVDDRVKDVDDKVKAVDDKLVAVIDGAQYIFNQLSKTVQLLTRLDGKEARGVIQQTADDVDQVKRNQLRHDLRRWLSPPDPSTNHNIACNAHHEGTATWFFRGSIYQDWKSTSSEPLLWIYGKPGSGKTILCSTIIQDIKVMCDARQASMAYFYYDFRDIDKQHWRHLITSLLTQLSSYSGPRCDILSRLYSKHDDGAQQPSDDTLTRCLKEMLTVPDQRPIYLIIDALDECSNTSGIPSHRNRVLQLLKELANLHLPNLHLCVTSRPEVDIREVLEPLTSSRVSLHDQSGQKKDIEDYVRSVVYSDLEPIMRRWRKEDKELVIETLSERADGMFRWIFCQLEVLRDCLPASVRRTLKELPESLDETYERILKEIKKPNRGLAQRVLQCLVVAIRPLRVAELAEVLAVDFDDSKGIPRLNADWRWEDQEQALLIACSSLIAIVEAGDGDSDVETGDSRVVQFSHFSVKEFLTSSRLSTACGEVSAYRIDLENAHTILAQACLGVLLQTHDEIEGNTSKDHPLARYAAGHWTTHAQFGEVLSRLQHGMEYIFNPDKPHFRVWLALYDIDTDPDAESTFFGFTPGNKSAATPLYYAALCGFHDLVEHLIAKYPQDVNADGGYYMRPLIAALAGKHFRTADSLRRSGADPHVQGRHKSIPLHYAASFEHFEVVQKLIEYDADIDARDRDGWTPLIWASGGHHFKDGSVLRLLLERGADVNARADDDGFTPLHRASRFGALEVVRLLLEHGADVDAVSVGGRTALQVVGEVPNRKVDQGRCDEITKLLVEHGAK
ncbi:hypothetical protein F5888DRAFT_1909336 [Russula emetica]|nr:hypothetical protein F5888DRAFT_1909336 [Russula emetica]